MEAFIWKESIYKNGFRCRCGAKLFDERIGQPTDNIGIDANKVNEPEYELWCVKCKNLVGKVKQIDDKYISQEEAKNVLNGNLDEWLENKASEMKQKAQERADERTRKKLQKEVQNLFDKLQTAERAMKRYKAECERTVASKDKQIQELTKELVACEARMKAMEKQMKGLKNENS